MSPLLAAGAQTKTFVLLADEHRESSYYLEFPSPQEANAEPIRNLVDFIRLTIDLSTLTELEEGKTKYLVHLDFPRWFTNDPEMRRNVINSPADSSGYDCGFLTLRILARASTPSKILLGESLVQWVKDREAMDKWLTAQLETNSREPSLLCVVGLNIPFHAYVLWEFSPQGTILPYYTHTNFTGPHPSS